MEDFEFIDGIFDLIKWYQEKEFLVFIITKQAGITPRFYTETDYKKLTDWMIKQFCKNGIQITKVYHSSHHPEIPGPYECRKPNPGMILDAIKEFNIDPVT
jgi:D-glycero-D-manno-heptose 1,7-bisphosphate phosphatase